MKTDIDVVVVGAGFAGLALAGELARQGLEVRVIERRPELPREGAAVTLQPNGIAALEGLGILEDALWAGTRFSKVSVRDGRDRELARWDYAELPHRHAHLLGIERFALLSILAGRLEERSLLFGHGLVDVLPDGVRHDRGELRARFVVGADGAGSAVRERLGIRAPSGRPDPYVVGFGARHPAMIDGQGLLYCGPGFANGLFPHKQHSYFWDHPTGESLRAVERGDFEGWRDRYLERIPAGANVVAGLSSFDDLTVLSGRYQFVPVRRWRGVTLVGDAAGAVHPHSGQGVNLALEDAAELAPLLAAGGEGLAGWARTRQLRRLAVVGWSVAAARSLDASTRLWRGLRTLNHGVSHIGPVRRTLLRGQAGLLTS
jgi:2-polyprenyl-6-methoxyphenol hydroxylase-like FAD-dependent oxidoreductase